MDQAEQDPRMPPGWSRQQLQLPRTLNKLLTAEAANFGHGGIKLIGSAAIAVYLGLPAEVRAKLLDWAIVTERRDASKIEPDQAWAVLWRALEDERVKQASAPLPSAKSHRADRISTPELSVDRSKQSKSRKPNGEAA